MVSDKVMADVHTRFYLYKNGAVPPSQSLPFIKYLIHQKLYDHVDNNEINDRMPKLCSCPISIITQLNQSLPFIKYLIHQKLNNHVDNNEQKWPYATKLNSPA